MDLVHPLVMQSDGAGIVLFLIVLAVGAGILYVAGPIVRMFVGVTDVTVGVLALYYPQWYLDEFGGKVLPYYFEEHYLD